MTCASANDTPQPTMPRTTTARNMEFAYKKYQQWGNKILHTMTPMQPATTTAKHNSVQVADVYAETSTAEDTAKLLDVATTRRPRVYDCMKDFLRRKFFQQSAMTCAKLNTSQCNASSAKATHSARHADDEDVTSDYDELDVLDSSYNADEEDATDCSCSYSSEAEHAPSAATANTTKCAQKSLLSLNCWHATPDTSSSNTSDDDEASARAAKHQQLRHAHDEDSDAGISDCAQLLPQSPSRRRTKRLQRKKQRKPQQRSSKNTHDEHVVSDLLAAAWYQPYITSKAATAQLQAASAGHFLIRRKARNYELCLRTANKIKCYTVLGHESGYYKLKGARKQFSTLRALVTHHSVMPEQLPMPLVLPRAEHTPQPRLSVRCADDFVVIESLEILDMLKCLQAQQTL